MTQLMRLSIKLVFQGMWQVCLSSGIAKLSQVPIKQMVQMLTLRLSKCFLKKSGLIWEMS